MAALAKSLTGTTCATIAELTGPWNALATPTKNRQTYTSATGPVVNETAASPSALKTAMNWLAMATRRRS